MKKIKNKEMFLIIAICAALLIISIAVILLNQNKSDKAERETESGGSAALMTSSEIDSETQTEGTEQPDEKEIESIIFDNSEENNADVTTVDYNEAFEVQRTMIENTEKMREEMDMLRVLEESHGWRFERKRYEILMEHKVNLRRVTLDEVNEIIENSGTIYEMSEKILKIHTLPDASIRGGTGEIYQFWLDDSGQKVIYVFNMMGIEKISYVERRTRYGGEEENIKWEDLIVFDDVEPPESIPSTSTPASRD